MRKNILRVLLLGLLIQFFMSIGFVHQAQAAVSNVYFNSMTSQSYRLDGGNTGSPYNILNSGYVGIGASSYMNCWSGQIYADQSYWTHINIAYTLNLPSGIKVTNARLYMYGVRDAEYYTSFTTPYLNGEHFNPQSSYLGPAWFSIDATSWFSLYSGGSVSASRTLEVTLPYTGTTGHPYSTSESFNTYFYNASYPPYIQITYEYVPSTPAISSPVAGSNNKTGITLSASSTVTGGALITYYWQYSIDNVYWSSICSTTATSYNWTIPTAIPDNSSIYVRCYASASGVYSGYSTSVRFNKADDPAIAAKLAAESAELTAQKALRVVGKPSLEVNSSTGATLTTSSTIALNFVYSNEMGNLTGMTYCYRNRGGAWSSWMAISDTGYCVAIIPLSGGYNLFEIKVKNADGVESKCARYNIWRI